MPAELDVTAQPTYTQIRRLEAAIPAALPEIGIDSLTAHEFCDGVYARKFFLPQGAVVVGKMHGKENFFLLVQGEVSILTEGGKVRRIKAPYMTITREGTKRVVYAHKDALMLTFHGNPDNSVDMDELEEQYIIPEDKLTLTHDNISGMLEKLV